MNFRTHLDQIWVGFDQLFNVLTGGWADETFSSRTWRKRDKQPFKTILPILGFVSGNPNHCEDAYKSERAFDDLPPEMRG